MTYEELVAEDNLNAAIAFGTMEQQRDARRALLVAYGFDMTPPPVNRLLESTWDDNPPRPLNEEE